MNAKYKTAGPIENFDGGWALIVFMITGRVAVGCKAHHWKDGRFRDDPDGSFTKWTSECGVTRITTDRAPALAHGTWPKCKNCQKIMAYTESHHG